MAQYGDRFIDFLNARGEGMAFSPAQKDELLMSVWLHDIGKLVIPLEVMNKMARLLPEQYTALIHRMEVIRLQAEIDCLAGRISQEEKEVRIQETFQTVELVDSINGTGFVTDEKLAELDNLREKHWTDGAGESQPWMTAEEYAMLSIRRGTLSQKEREIMEEHVAVTDKLLSQIRFSADLAHVRQWASSHHELLNGSGYPNHLMGNDIPYEVRIITILDIFDALVADDRPYKPGMPVPKALSILEAMAEKEGKLDPKLTKLFIESRCWEEPAG